MEEVQNDLGKKSKMIQDVFQFCAVTAIFHFLPLTAP